MAYRPKHFKVHCSIQNHPKTIAVFDDDALLAMYVRCGVLAIERFADRTGESFLVNSRDLERLAGCRGVANARRKLGRLEANSPLTVCQEGAGYRLTFPNLRKKQGFQSEAVPKLSPSPTPTPTPTPKRKRESSTQEPAAPRSPDSGDEWIRTEGLNGTEPKPPKVPRRVTIPKPEHFCDASKDRLRAWAARKKITTAQLNAGRELFDDWEPVKPPYRRTIEQWEAAFKRIVREAVESGEINRTTNPDRKPAGQAYEPWRGYQEN